MDAKQKAVGAFHTRTVGSASNRPKILEPRVKTGLNTEEEWNSGLPEKEGLCLWSVNDMAGHEGFFWSGEEVQALFNICSEKQLFVFQRTSQLGEMDFLFRSWLTDELAFPLPDRRSFQAIPPHTSSCCACPLLP